ncbi:MAG: FAD-dependent oxidoreductase, partial [Pseudomonadota bacterium]
MDLLKNHKTVLVIGGGIAGLTAAKELVQSGIGTHLVEKSPFLGGHAANLACKATDRCLKCNDCLVEEQLRGISQERRMHIHLNTEVEEISREGQQFKITLRSAPQWIHPERCTDCGLCYEKCPRAGEGAIVLAVSPHLHPRYALEPARCAYFQEGRKEKICQSVCPEGAINLDEKEAFTHLEADGIVLATGYRPSDPREIKRYNFTRFQNMVTGMDLEKMLRQEGRIVRPSDGLLPKSVAFVQCVGSRDAQLHREYCSRVCCGYALRMALRVSHE